jgi:hypothetical protein
MSWQRVDADRRAYQRSKYAEEYIERACVGMDSAALVKCVKDAIETSREDQRSEYDLSAQEDMARCIFIHENAMGREPQIDGVNKDGQLITITVGVFAVDVFGKAIESFESGEFIRKRKLPKRFRFFGDWQASGIYFDIEAMRRLSWPDKAKKPKAYGYRHE